MVDFKQNKVVDGDYLMEADEETADFYVVRNSKPEYFARWSWENNLYLVNIQEKLKELDELREEIEHERFYRNYMTSVYKHKLNVKTEYLYKVNDEVKLLLDRLLETGETIKINVDHICYIGKQ